MTALRFLADMNVSPKTVAALAGRGWDIVRVSDVLPVDASDEDVLSFAFPFSLHAPIDAGAVRNP